MPPVPEPLAGTWVEGDGSANWHPYPTHVVTDISSTIIDESIKAHRIKACTHTKTEYVFNDVQHFDYAGYDPTNAVQPGRYRWAFHGPYALQVGLCGPTNWWRLPRAVDLAINWEQSDEALMAAAMARFHDGNEVDNFTNIRESGQTVDMIRGLGDTWRTSLLWMPSRRLLKRGTLVPDWSRALKFYSGKVQKMLRELPSAIANGYLAYSFGVAPLVSDMRKMARAMETLESDMNRATRRTSRRTAHASCGASLDVIHLESEGNYAGPVGTASDYSWRLKLSNEFVAKKVATVVGKDYTHYNTKVFRNLDYMMRRFLSAGPASALWEAIPYSFVLDWFVNSSAVIDSLDNTLTGGKRVITDGCISTKYDYLGTASVLQPKSTNTHVVVSGVDGVEWGHSRHSSYHRVPFAPSFWVGKSGRFGKKQASLLGALLHQRVASLKGR